jgi:hypothetical protein
MTSSAAGGYIITASDVMCANQDRVITVRALYPIEMMYHSLRAHTRLSSENAVRIIRLILGAFPLPLLSVSAGQL